MGSIPGHGIKILSAEWCCKKKKKKMYLRMELIFKVHLLYVECYVRFVMLIPHIDFERIIELPTFHRG